ncbi:MAG: response regulator [Candidatus Saccharimonadales bacterium]
MDKKILIVEDNKSLRNVLSDTFEDEGFIVKVADDGAVALATIESWLPDVILLDILMPNMDGKEMLTKLRALPDGDKVIVMVLTNSDTSDKVLDFLNLGVTDYLTKADWELEDIVTKVKERLNMSA